MRQADSPLFATRAAAALLMALGLAVFIGWGFEIEALKRVLPGANSMKVNTAIGFLLCGTALWFTASQRTDAIARVARRWAPIVAGTLGALALFEYATNINLGIDEAIFRDDVTYGARGRMSVIAALAFILFATAMSIPAERARRNNVAFLTLTTIGFFGAVLASIGYLYQLPLLYRPFPASAIAVHTALGLVVAFAGVFATRPDLGWLALARSKGVAGIFAWQVLPAIMLAPLLLGWLALAVQDLGWANGRTAVALFVFAVIGAFAVIVARAGAALTRLQSTLSHRDEIYKAITENALDAFMLADADGRVIDWNPQAEKMFGWTREEAMGRIVRELIMPPETRAGHAAGLDRFKGGTEYEYFGRRVEVETVRRDGSRIKTELIAIPMRVADGLFFALFCRDLTDLKAAEEQLRQAQKMEAVGRLTGGIAHDFNNTLTAIIATLDSALPRVPDPIKPRIETALAAADRAAAMIKQMLAFSRKQVLSPTSLDVNDIVSHTADVLRPTLGEVVRISVALQPDLPHALADGGQVESALLNLSINARDAMPDGGKLTIETALSELDQAYCAQNADVAPGTYVMIAVSDTGSGMSEETISRAFEPFFSTKPVDRGTGLGLSMVHGFAKQSGGHVKIYSELGHGTTVRLYLPLAARDARTATVQAPPSPRSTGNETILLVEDNPLVRAVGLTTLRDLGYTVLEASDAQEAQAVMATGAAIDLLFTDIIMPGITGVALAEIAARERPGLRVLFTSGYTDNAVAQNSQLEAGAPFLSKPYRAHELAAAIRRVLDQPASAITRKTA